MEDRITLAMPPAESVGMSFRLNKNIDGWRYIVLLMCSKCKDGWYECEAAVDSRWNSGGRWLCGISFPSCLMNQGLRSGLPIIVDSKFLVQFNLNTGKSDGRENINEPRLVVS